MDPSSTNGHNVWHKDLPANQYLALHSNGDAATDSAMFPSGGAANTTFTIGSNLVDGMQVHAALFRSVEGYSHFGLWEADGTVPQTYHLGFRPAFVMLKCTNVNNTNWIVFDSSRETFNQIDYPLFANTSGSEPSSGWGIDFLSNGFAWRSTSSEGYDGRKYIVCAWAETPSRFANAR